MTSIMRKSVRGAATGLGALAIVAGASGCGSLLGGGDDGEQKPADEKEQPAEDDGAAKDDGAAAEDDGSAGASDAGGDTEAAGAGSAASDGGGDAAAAGELSDEDLTAGSEMFVEFLQVLDDDTTGACEMIYDPTTKGAPSDEFVTGCAPGLESGFEAQGIQLEPGMFDAFDASMVELTDNGDGTAAVAVAGTDMGMNVIKADDGEWYVQAPM
ncbi:MULTISPECIES: hypothetical protein [unclassified Brachybacterium]|uniref:hypothetical protein n=1 Tax=unclassified Brachybacterium TaxID=2623841 RepID=UPI004034DA61